MQIEHIHTINSGDYDVTVLGEIFKFGVANSSAKTNLKEIKQWGNGFDFGGLDKAFFSVFNTRDFSTRFS